MFWTLWWQNYTAWRMAWYHQLSLSPTASFFGLPFFFCFGLLCKENVTSAWTNAFDKVLNRTIQIPTSWVTNCRNRCILDAQTYTTCMPNYALVYGQLHAQTHVCPTTCLDTYCMIVIVIEILTKCYIIRLNTGHQLITKHFIVLEEIPSGGVCI